MAYKFKLATVLRLREIAEEREERLLGKILEQIAQVRQNLVEIAERRGQLVQLRQSELEGRTSAAMLQSSYGQTAALDLAAKQAEEKLKQFEGLRDKQMQIYTAAHCDRELLADLRTEHRTKYQAALALQEQKAMDDNFNARRKR